MLVAAVHYLYSINFPTQDSITLLAVVMMGGAYSLPGAVVAALLYQLLPLLNNWDVSADWLIIWFWLGVLQVLTTAPAGLADLLPRDLGNRIRCGIPACWPSSRPCHIPVNCLGKYRPEWSLAHRPGTPMSCGSASPATAMSGRSGGARISVRHLASTRALAVVGQVLPRT